MIVDKEHSIIQNYRTYKTDYNELYNWQMIIIVHTQINIELLLCCQITHANSCLYVNKLLLGPYTYILYIHIHTYTYTSPYTQYVHNIP